MSQQTIAVRPPSAASRLVWALVSTMLLAVFIGWRMGWAYALAGVFGVIVHEYGHVLAINALGCGPGRMKIIPFVGGAAIPAIAPPTEFKGVLIALAGPAFGLVAMAPFILAYAVVGDPMWLGAAFFIAFINLVNLAPAPPLDGSKAFGPVLARIHPWVERGALVAVGAAVVLWAVSRGSFIFAIFLALGIRGSLRRGALRPWALRLTDGQWLASFALYVGALVLCAASAWLTLGGRLGFGLETLMRLIGR